ncbi:MAG: hypothetical protein N3D74_06255 [Caldisericia bacterium]|nr:hypothetical protein [Caldisericia bacterium]
MFESIGSVAEITSIPRSFKSFFFVIASNLSLENLESEYTTIMSNFLFCASDSISINEGLSLLSPDIASSIYSLIKVQPCLRMKSLQIFI